MRAFKKILLIILFSLSYTGYAFSENSINCTKLKNTLTTFRIDHHIGAMSLYVSTPLCIVTYLVEQ
ncbi:MAG: hypothetical protein ACD_46C00121G0001 [uncultured bacterium]|nr:MAG: hypothetical protein ACD_46C00121G0001 [uncultured bacterium]